MLILPRMGSNGMAAAARARCGAAVRLVAFAGLCGQLFRADARAAWFDSPLVTPAALEELQKALLPQKT